MTPQRTIITAAIALAAVGTAIAPAAPVSALGGWAVTTVDAFALPEPGAPVDVTFTIRQHGVTPVDVDGVAILVEDTAGHVERFAAAGTGTVGHYVASVVFPAEGSFEWSVEQGWFGPQELGVIEVVVSEPVKAAAVAASSTGSSSEPRWPLGVRVGLPLAAAALAGLAVIQLRRPARRTEAV